jgi:hypothetical protein
VFTADKRYRELKTQTAALRAEFGPDERLAAAL